MFFVLQVIDTFERNAIALWFIELILIHADWKEIGRAHSELQSHHDLVCRLLLEKKKTTKIKKKNTK